MLGLFICYLISINLYSFYALFRKSSKEVSYLLRNPIYDLECGDINCECRNWGVCSRFTGYITGMNGSDRPLILGLDPIRWIKA